MKGFSLVFLCYGLDGYIVGEALEESRADKPEGLPPTSMSILVPSVSGALPGLSLR
jgi:hypothetical protein